jgi:cytochrome c biogenesis protein CcmG/thiol:disulfide interchange protein DsbE
LCALALSKQKDEMNRRTLVTVLALTAFVAVVAIAVVARGGTPAASATSAPRLTGTTLQREGFDLAQGRGKPTVVNFFASWCPACASEAADIAAFAEAHPEVNVVGVAINDKRANVQRLVYDYRLPYTIVLDPKSVNADAWGVNGIPATFFLDDRGRTAASIVGAATRDQFEEKLKTIL